MHLCKRMLPGVVAFCLAVLVSAPADAKLVATQLPLTLGPIGRPNTVAVDQATGDVYVADHATDTVKIFGAEGEAPSIGVPTEVTGEETPSGSFSFLGAAEPVGVAVAESGDLYVADVGHKVVDKFKLEGGAYKYVCQYAGFGNVGNGCLPNLTMHETTPTKPFTGPGGIAIDHEGNVYVSDFSGAVYEFNAAGEDVRQATISSGEPSGLAVDPNGVVYVQDYQGPVYKLTHKGASEFEVTGFDPGKSWAVAVDSVTGDVYLDHDVYVAILEAADGLTPGVVIGELQPEGAFSSEGVAINGIGQDLYASNSLTESIDIFKITRLPDVRLDGEATEVMPTSATVHGEIDPEETSGASYYVEYGTGGTLTSATSPTGAGEGNAFVSATAELSGLLPNTTYHYRLVGTNSSGLANPSEEGTFTTAKARPEVSGVKAADITTSSAVFLGDVNPQSDATSYRFEYGETPSYGERLPEVAIALAATPVAVEQASLTNLSPNTTYHYRLVAVNSTGETPSLDQTFKTPSAGTPPENPPVVSTEGVESVTPNSATLTATVYPEETATTYLFEFGSTTAYGTVLFGGEAGREAGSAVVSQAVGNLQPGVVYHYRVAAFNAAGVAVGADRSFTTPSPPTGIVQPIAPQLLAIPVFPAVKISSPKTAKKPKKKAKAKKARAKKKPKARSAPRARAKRRA